MIQILLLTNMMTTNDSGHSYVSTFLRKWSNMTPFTKDYSQIVAYSKLKCATKTSTIEVRLNGRFVGWGKKAKAKNGLLK